MIEFLLAGALSLFILVLIARMIVDWAGVLNARGSFVYGARRVTYAITEPVLSPVRRVLPPVRFGAVGIDLAFTVVFIGAILLRSVVVAIF
ncbi:YggT family protein [Lentzea tibetensis]|uniref:YggT family protein n=1 Tax=Lentzea tibetensis TaxID=2591470 RepID=A0A563F2R2_9PSEU|nr:YggT family protein [Lentzea tibetensis]TWP54250.1 YggT family protein [Lentzea tibetensis]